MKTFRPFTLAAWLVLLWPAAASAQPAAPAARPAASAPAPRLLSPTEQRDNSDVSPEPSRRLEGPVAPQIRIPLGRKPPPVAVTKPAPARRAGTGSAAGVDDGAARCEAQVDATARAACRERLTHATPPR
jgi:hypothetical protein